MFAVPRGRLPPPLKKEESLEGETEKLSLNGNTDAVPNGATEDADEEKSEEVLLGFARLFSGTLTLSSSSSKLYALLPKYTTSLPPSHPRNAPYILGPLRITALYEMMGRDLVRVEEVRAGNVFALEGLEGVVGRNATICEVRDGEGDVKSSAKPLENVVNLASVHNSVSSFSPHVLDMTVNSPAND